MPLTMHLAVFGVRRAAATFLTKLQRPKVPNKPLVGLQRPRALLWPPPCRAPDPVCAYTPFPATLSPLWIVVPWVWEEGGGTFSHNGPTPAMPSLCSNGRSAAAGSDTGD